MSGLKNSEKPEVYALRQDGGDWQISRRGFLKAAGIGAAALSAGLESGCSRTKPLDKICGNVIAHNNTITGMTASVDGEYLVSLDRDHEIRCWDFAKQSLLGSVTRSFENFAVGPHNEKSCLFLSRNDGRVRCLELPLPGHSEDRPAAELLTEEMIVLPESGPMKMAVDPSGNLYTAGSGTIRFYRAANNYQQAEILYELNSKRDTITDIRLFDENRRLFVLWSGNNGFGVLDLSKKAMSYFDTACTAYSLLPDGHHALICSGKEYHLVSLDDHAEIWTQEIPKPGEENKYDISAAAVTPDGTVGILLITDWSNCYLLTVSMADGSRLHEYSLADLIPINTFAGPVVSRDGTKLAVSLFRTIFFFSLPDLQLIGCPIDMDAAKNNMKGVEISASDSVTGESYTYTMPCGAAIPEGAVCTCNCVKGRGGCACDGHGRSNKNSGSSSGGGHYWHPN